VKPPGETSKKRAACACCATFSDIFLLENVCYKALAAPDSGALIPQKTGMPPVFCFVFDSL
jgi:hypothetical protein